MEETKTFKCDLCGKTDTIPKSDGTGYATLASGHRACYVCCAEQDKSFMRRHGKNTLYLATNQDTGCYNVTNWPNSLSFKVQRRTVGDHNMTGKRYDVWFVFEGFWWWGVTYGDNTQICHCKRTKDRE